jgi:hypothetical protein
LYILSFFAPRPTQQNIRTTIYNINKHPLSLSLSPSHSTRSIFVVLHVSRYFGCFFFDGSLRVVEEGLEGGVEVHVVEHLSPLEGNGYSEIIKINTLPLLSIPYPPLLLPLLCSFPLSFALTLFSCFHSLFPSPLPFFFKSVPIMERVL